MVYNKEKIVHYLMVKKDKDNRHNKKITEFEKNMWNKIWYI